MREGKKAEVTVVCFVVWDVRRRRRRREERREKKRPQLESNDR